MTKRKAKSAKEAKTMVANDPEDRKGALKTIGGFQSDHWDTRSLTKRCRPSG